MSKYTSHQAELNLGTEQFALVRQKTTHEVRVLIQNLTGKDLTAQQLLQQGRTGPLQLPSPYGTLIIAPDSSNKRNRLWRWSIDFVPICLYRAS